MRNRLTKKANVNELKELLQNIQMVFNVLADENLKKIGLMAWEALENGDIETAKSLFQLISPELRKVSPIITKITESSAFDNLSMGDPNKSEIENIIGDKYTTVFNPGAIILDFEEHFNGTNSDNATACKRRFITYVTDDVRDLEQVIEMIKSLIKLHE